VLLNNISISPSHCDEILKSHCGVTVTDVSLLASHHDKESAVSYRQQAVDAVALWSKKKKMTLNTDKSEVAFFSIDTHEAKWQPIISLNRSQLPFNASPPLLGVHLDRTLSFSHHTCL